MKVIKMALGEKYWRIVFLIVAIVGVVEFILFMFDKAGMKIGISGIFVMMVALWYSLFVRMNAIEKDLLIRTIEMKKKIKELKDEK